ncbi:MAG: hypothetical protein ACLP7I_12960, partial [Limisphaerales bacterium]
RAVELRPPRRQSKWQTHSEAETFHVCAGVNEKPKRLPEELAAKLKPYLSGAIGSDKNEHE